MISLDLHRRHHRKSRRKCLPRIQIRHYCRRCHLHRPLQLLPARYPRRISENYLQKIMPVLLILILMKKQKLIRSGSSSYQEAIGDQNRKSLPSFC